jgi:RNA polymerase-binding protein DksA
MKMKSAISEKQIKRYRSILLDLKDKILGNLSRLEEQALHSGRDITGDLSGYALHMADAGTDNFDRELALNFAGNEREILYQIDQALARIEQGRFGLCEMFGTPIPLNRLDAVPWTPYCLEAAERIERERKMKRRLFGDLSPAY